MAVSPYGVAFMGAANLMQGVAKSQADLKQADAERQNADFYRDEAQFAQESGDRQLLLYDRQSKVTYGEQASGFAKAGVDSQESSRFLAQQELYGNQNENAIQVQTNLNVKLATMRANQADQEASNLDSSSGWDLASGVVGAGASVATIAAL